MKLPARVKQIIRSLYEVNVALARGSDAQRRQLVMLIAQQARFELGPTWGTKRADKGRPASKDAIALLTDEGTMIGWDLIDGTTRVPFTDPNSMDMSSQIFIDVSPGVDHLGAGTAQPPVVVVPPTPPVPPVPPSPPPPPVVAPVENYQPQLDALRTEVILLARAFEGLLLEVNDLKARLSKPVRTSNVAYHSHEVQF